MDCAGPQCGVEKGEQQMTRIAIVEDEAAVREQLAGYVQRYTRQYGTPFEVTEFADGMEILEDYRPQFDIIFLDVEMKHLDGMETARRIRERDGGVLIVFITNMADFPLVNAEYSKVFAENPPARSCVAVKELPLGGLVEIEVLAVV